MRIGHKTMINIDKVIIEGLFGHKDIVLDINNDVTVLVGKNGRGKSTILGIIRALLLKDPAAKELDHCKNAKVIFSNGSWIKSSKLNINNKNIASIIKEIRKSGNNKNEVLSLDLEVLDFLKKQFSPKLTQEGDIPNFVVDFISTINMSANSTVEITSSDGISQKFLDIEINWEVDKFFNKDDKNYDVFLEEINEMFHDSNKRIFIDNKQFIILNKENNKVCDMEDLSSGERQLIYILLKAINSSEQSSILLMDEPEISLHLFWQEKLIRCIKKINKNAQLLIVTHSPAIIMDGWMNSYIDIDDI